MTVEVSNRYAVGCDELCDSCSDLLWLFRARTFVADVGVACSASESSSRRRAALERLGRVSHDEIATEDGVNEL